MGDVFFNFCEAIPFYAIQVIKEVYKSFTNGGISKKSITQKIFLENLVLIFGDCDSS